MNGGGAEVMNVDARTRGIKRTQGEALDDDHRFAKRFNLLNIENNRKKLYIPVSSRSQTTTPPPQQQPQPPLQPSPPTNSSQDDHMQLDDTKDRVYIYNLDDELADTESSEEKMIFLPDIEKQLSKIPKHILTGERPETEEEQQLVLYSVPASISVPVEKDSVRKAILEARQRAREKASQNTTGGITIHLPDYPETAHGFGASDYGVDDTQDDPDAMDIG